MVKLCKIVVAAMSCAALVACGPSAIKPDGDGLPAYRIDDGSLCQGPANFADIVDASSTRQVRSLFLGSAPPEEIVISIRDLPSHEFVEAAFYLSCAEYARGELSKDVFAQQRRIYQQLRLAHLVAGIQEWREDPDGYVSPGKLCHFIFNNGAPDKRDLTRLVPAEASVDDCAIFVHQNGGTHVLLGCSEGRWETRWAEQRLLVGPNGWADRHRTPVGTRYVPEPNCGWS